MISTATLSHNVQGTFYAESEAASLTGQHEDPFEDGEEEEDDELQLPERLTKNGRRRALSFPLKLMKVLSMNTNSGVVEWTPSGKAFKILDTDKFESEVMATHFKSAKYSSFLRKLRRWGYDRLYRGPDSGAYYHRQFRRDRIENAVHMVCLKRVPSTKTRTLDRPTSARKPVSRAFSQLPVVSRESSFTSSNHSQLMTEPTFHRVPRQNDLFPQVQFHRPAPSTFNALFDFEVSRRVQECISMNATNGRSPSMSSFLTNQACTSLNEQLGLRQQQLALMYSQTGMTNKLVPQAPPSASPEMDQYLPMLATIFGAKTA